MQNYLQGEAQCCGNGGFRELHLHLKGFGSRREGKEGQKWNYRVSSGELLANWEGDAGQRAFPSVMYKSRYTLVHFAFD